MPESTTPVSRDNFSLLPPYVAPRTATEEKLAEIWARRLGVGRVGITDMYEDLGGSSLAAAAIAVEIGKTFGMEVKMDTLIRAPTVEELALKIDELARATRGE